MSHTDLSFFCNSCSHDAACSTVVLLHVGNLLYRIAVCVAQLNLKAADGENVTISFKTAGLERADQVKITFTRGCKKNLIAQYCRCAHCGDCDAVETPGVVLRVEEGTLTLLRVSSNNSGLYEVIIIGNNVSEMKVTLVVNKPPFSSSIEPRQTSISKPPNVSERHRLCVLPALVVFSLGVLGVYLLYKWKRGCEPVADAEAARDPV
ncbi:uncharacterized protein [Sinocyclocheilus grahami]|uniref:uncharacterized protein isoform X2 n=1 Tax=Sinocyclocheilus grahami TaxID=75366 RepID=UPI0007AD5C63|nr:PREDICTED: uncharacterized protein LOC107564416 isoform X2 [Sinocyclocheilus grahami]